MLYANLDEVYPVKKNKNKKKNNKQESVDGQDLNNRSNFASSASEYESTVPLYKTVNHCTPLEAPPYKFPVSDESLEQFNKALDVMDNVEDTQDLDEFDTYLKKTENEEESIVKEIPFKRRKAKKKVSKDNKYEILLFIAIGLILIFMCEIIARIVEVKSRL